MTLETLADRIEGLTGPDREVDRLIADAMGAIPSGYERAIEHGNPKPFYWHCSDSKAPYWMPERYTASLDAARTLMPAGFDFMLDNFDGARAGFRCSAGVFVSGDWCDCKGATTPALALCAAALRARSAVAKGVGSDG